MKEKTLGVLGGMGSYATVSTLKKILDKTPAKKEWDYPHVIIDNNPKLPSRVRAILYNEKVEELISGICNSIKNLHKIGADIVFIPCNTAYYFLKKVLDKDPSLKIFNMIESVDNYCAKKGYKIIGVLASEGTILGKVYDFYLNENFTIKYPTEQQFNDLREVIEAVKQQKISNKTYLKLVGLINSLNNVDVVVLACTEFSVVWELSTNKYKKISKNEVIDALDIGIDDLLNYIKLD